MSGGVDSSVAAALLKKQGYDVAGVFMRFWAEPEIINGQEVESKNTCCSAGAEAAARQVAAKLKIPFYTLNFEKEFKKAVVDYFLTEEKRGRTPNPCVVCNKQIKFGLLFNKALKMADFLATGHYVKVKDQKSKVEYKLLAAKDKNKDQSYFLYNLNQAQLAKIIFPLADYTKEEVYQFAKKWKLPYRKDESFDLCFVASDRESFIKKYLELKPGRIVDQNGNILGEHEGLALYTVGQRKRLSLNQGPWWVIKKDERRNILCVSNNENDLMSLEFSVDRLNWISGRTPKLPAKVLVKIRYKSEPAQAHISRGSAGAIKVKFLKPQRAITPGQSAVFYDKKKLLGGGVIL